MSSSSSDPTKGLLAQSGSLIGYLLFFTTIYGLHLQQQLQIVSSGESLFGRTGKVPIFLASIVIMFPIIFCTRHIAGSFAKKYIKSGPKRDMNVKKFRMISSELICYIIISGVCQKLLSPSWWDQSTLWIRDHEIVSLSPIAQLTSTSTPAADLTELVIGETKELELSYIFLMAYSYFNFFSLKYLEEIESDHALMIWHHIITSMLLSGSWFLGVSRIGVIVYYVHAISDIPISVMKCAHYFDLDMDNTGVPVVESLFVFNLASWIYYRLYLYPLNLIHSCVHHIHIHYPPISTSHSFGLLFMKVLLSSLLVMHVYWFYRMLVLAVKLVKGESADDVASGELDKRSLSNKKKD